MTQAFLIALTGLLVVAAAGDIRSRRIPNKLVLGVCGLYGLFAVLVLTGVIAGPGIPSVLGALKVAGITFLGTVALFAMGLLGGGDAKLIPAVALWMGEPYIAPFLIIMTLVGGLLAGGMLIKSKLAALKQNVVNTDAGTNKIMVTDQVPYGVAIAAGGIFVTSQLIVNAFASPYVG